MEKTGMVRAYDTFLGGWFPLTPEYAIGTAHDVSASGQISQDPDKTRIDPAHPHSRRFQTCRGPDRHLRYRTPPDQNQTLPGHRHLLRINPPSIQSQVQVHFELPLPA